MIADWLTVIYSWCVYSLLPSLIEIARAITESCSDGCNLLPQASTLVSPSKTRQSTAGRTTSTITSAFSPRVRISSLASRCVLCLFPFSVLLLVLYVPRCDVVEFDTDEICIVLLRLSIPLSERVGCSLG